MTNEVIVVEYDPRWPRLFEEEKARLLGVVGDQIEAERLHLTGITYDDGDDIVVIGLDAPGGTKEEAERVIYDPRTIYLATEDGGAATFDIEDAEGHKTLVRLEPAG